MMKEGVERISDETHNDLLKSDYPVLVVMFISH